MVRLSLGAVVLTALLLPAVTAQQFTFDSSQTLSPHEWTDGVELADVDGDGDLDILFANGSVYGGSGTAGQQPQHMWLNDGSGTFTAAHGDLNLSTTSGEMNAKMVIAEDIDNDGDLDLLYASGSTGSPPRVLINDGSGVFADETGTRMPALALRSFGIAAGDIDCDGDLDVAVSDGGTFFGNATQLTLLENDGAGNFSDITSSQLPSDTYNCQDITMLDIDEDGDIDIALSGKGAGGKRGRLYLNDGTGDFSISNSFDLLGTNQTYEIDYGDLDGDGDFDAAVQSISSQTEGWGENTGTASAWPETTFSSPHNGDDNEMACFDYDNDGDLDVFVGSLTSAERVYRNTAGVMTKINGVIQSQSDATLDIAIGDLDGDDKYDLVTAQGESTPFRNKIYFNSGSADTLAPSLTDRGVKFFEDSAIYLVQVEDAISDDGHINATVDVTVTGSTSDGGGEAEFVTNVTHMGGGLFRAEVEWDLDTTSTTVTLEATDQAGNSASLTDLQADGPFEDIGFGKAGVSGVPLLDGDGTLAANSNCSLDLTNAAASTSILLFASLSSTPTAFKGGTLAANPAFIEVLLGTDGTGAFSLPFVWPEGAPAGTEVWFQYAIQDNAAPQKVSMSNAVKATTP